MAVTVPFSGTNHFQIHRKRNFPLHHHLHSDNAPDFPFHPANSSIYPLCLFHLLHFHPTKSLWCFHLLPVATDCDNVWSDSKQIPPFSADFLLQISVPPRAFQVRYKYKLTFFRHHQMPGTSGYDNHIHIHDSVHHFPASESDFLAYHTHTLSDCHLLLIASVVGPHCRNIRFFVLLFP